jgi:cytochrome c-type biogenesis protein
VTDLVTVSLGLAFLAGLVSFLSPCVFPIVPSYVGFVTGLTLDELREGSRADARRQAAVHAALFVLGFSLIFLALGASVTVLGGVLRRSLPLLQQVGGIVIAAFGLYLLGVLRMPALMRERRVQLASKPAGKLGSVVVGIAFGAGWTPCVGPVLASVLLYASFEQTLLQGMLLLGAYALGLGIPFFVAAVALNWFLAGSARVRRWLLPLERAAGAVMVLLGVLLFTGHFAVISAFLAQFSPAFDVGL